VAFSWENVVSINFRESVVFDKTHFTALTSIREAFNWERNKSCKLNDSFVVETGNARLFVDLTPTDAQALMVLLKRYIEASTQNAQTLAEQASKVAV
jgi:hypothetical protein